jgi:hypothetical protein
MLPQSIPSTRKFWLAFRAEVYAELERQGIKRTTASIILGQWQKEIGYDMRFLK